MAGGAAAGAIVAGMIVRSHESQQRIVQARLVQVEEDGVDAVERAEAAFGQAARRFAGRLGGVGDAELQLLFSASLKDTKNIAGLPNGEARKRFDQRKD